MVQLDHLQTVCMGYTEHARLSFALAWLFLRGAVSAAVHAIFPFVLGSSSTAYASELTRRIRAAGCESKRSSDESPEIPYRTKGPRTSMFWRYD